MATARWKKTHDEVAANANNARSLSETVRNTGTSLARQTNEHLMRVSRDTEDELNRRIDDIMNRKLELRSCIEGLHKELDNLQGHAELLKEELQAKDEPLAIARENQEARTKRIGVDLFDDPVDEALASEVQRLTYAQEEIKRKQEETTEQLRVLRAARFQLEEDLKDKYQAFDIDTTCRELNSTFGNLSDTTRLRQQTEQQLPPQEWWDFTKHNITKAEKARSASVTLRQAIDELVRKLNDSLVKQNNIVEDAFNTRLAEYREAKHNAEQQLHNTQLEVGSQQRAIEEIEEALDAKQAPLEIAQTRLEKRAARPNVELVRDTAQFKLVREVEEIEKVVKELEEQKRVSLDAVRTLKRAALALQEDIDCKINSMNIDNACMKRRQDYKYRAIKQ